MAYRQNFLYSFALFSLLILVACSNQETLKKNDQGATPEQVVRAYFEAWDRKDWKVMYPVISDGFKKIDPDAKDQEAFSKFASNQGIEGIKILNLKETLFDETTAAVDYSIEFKLSNGATRKFDSTYTLKYRAKDKVSGWKLIHPYGPNVDTS